MIDPEQVITVYTNRIKKSGWVTINRTDRGIQIKKAQKFNMLGFWVGLVLLPFWGIGFVFWVLAIIDYSIQLLKGNEIRFVTVDQMVQQLKAAK